MVELCFYASRDPVGIGIGVGLVYVRAVGGAAFLVKGDTYIVFLELCHLCHECSR